MEKTAASGSVEPLCVRFTTGVDEQVRFKPSFALVRREYGVKNRSLQRFHPFIHCFCVCFVDLSSFSLCYPFSELITIVPFLGISTTPTRKFVWIITWYNTFGVPEVVPRKSTRHWIFLLFVCLFLLPLYWVLGEYVKFLLTTYNAVLMWVNLTDVCEVMLC